MANAPIINVSGLRGTIGETLTPETAIRYVGSFVETLSAGPIVVTRDSRPSGELLAGLITGALGLLGRETIDAGICATPTTGVLVRQYRAAGGIQISASHNPSPYNGIKLFSTQGRVISADAGGRVLQRYRDDRPLRWVPYDRIGTVRREEHPHREHLRLVLATVDVERIRSRRFSVLLDANAGAGSPLGRELLEQLGCRVILIGDRPDGRFLHGPEPTAENLGEIGRRVVESGSQIGFCQDPDADRLALIDARGRYIGEEYTIVLCMRHVLQSRKGPIVTNCSSSRMSRDVAEQFGVPYYRSSVGEANVTDKMLAVEAVFGGEGNGGPIDPRVGYVRDSFVGMALVLDAMARQDESLEQLIEPIPRYAICKTKIALEPSKIPRVLDALENHFAEARADRMDGLRLDWPDRWLLVRASNTEPIVRAIAEAPTDEAARSACDEAARVIEAI